MVERGSTRMIALVPMLHTGERVPGSSDIDEEIDFQIAEYLFRSEGDKAVP